MSEKPIIFSGPVVRAILDGRKTQTRRVVNRFRRFGPVTEFGKSTTSGYDWHFRDRRLRWNDFRHDDLMKFAPYKPGDTLWVRETHLLVGGNNPDRARVVYRESNHGPDQWISPSWSPSIHMPRWASRINLGVTNVRVERLQDISEDDCWDEGIEGAYKNNKCPDCGISLAHMVHRDCNFTGNKPPRDYFAELWNSINAKRAPWDGNPWVWVIEFEREAV